MERLHRCISYCSFIWGGQCKKSIAAYFLLFRLRSHLKNLCFGFHQGSQTPRNYKIKALGLFICFSVCGTPDETLALVFYTLLDTWANNQPKLKRSVACNSKHVLQQVLHGKLKIVLIILILQFYRQRERGRKTLKEILLMIRT